MRILFITSELSPLVSTGGLAEVAAALPGALKNRGIDIRLGMPCYRQIPFQHRGTPICSCKGNVHGHTEYGALRETRHPDSGIPLYFVEHEGYFGRESPYGSGAYEYDDNAERFCFFCQALLDGIKQLGWKPDLVHCNDWHAAPAVLHLKTTFLLDEFWREVPCLFTIHNLAFQGRYGAHLLKNTGLDERLFHSGCLEYEGDFNLMKGALTVSDTLSTVSPRYAQEIQTVEYGAGLHDILSARRDDLFGILNGVDYQVWHPSRDAYIAAAYNQHDLSGKNLCKQQLQDMFGLPRKACPVVGIVSRLHWQKGIDLVIDAIPDLMRHNLQLVILGAGNPDYESRLHGLVHLYPDKLAVYFGFDVSRAHGVQAGSDFFLMPSRYEPCGIGQLYAMAYGTLPIVRRTGGLADTVTPYRPLLSSCDQATGFCFIPQTWQALYRCVQHALAVYEDPSILGQLRKNAMSKEFSWDHSSRAYEDLYRRTLDKYKQRMSL